MYKKFHIMFTNHAKNVKMRRNSIHEIKDAHIIIQLFSKLKIIEGRVKF